MSDIHLGSKWSKAKEATRFLKRNSCDTLILCGDIIDGWNLMRGKKNKWKKKHTKFIKLLLDLQYKTKIVYLRGNHDDFLEQVLPFHFLNLEIVRDYIYESAGKRFFVLHGDVYDAITTRFTWLSKIGDVGYTILMNINERYNKRRREKGLPYYSLSSDIKQKVKTSVSYISDYEQQIVKIAEKKKCDGVICGHIHHPEMRYYGDTLYLNSGDWVESLSALTEDYSGNWNLVYYEEEKNVDFDFDFDEDENETNIDTIAI